jgi:chromosomal replication initiator protein
MPGCARRAAALWVLVAAAIRQAFRRGRCSWAIRRPRPRNITVDNVIKAVASYYGLKPSDIKSERRHKSVATPRAVAMYISRHHTKDSYPDLARAFGGKHHTTVISAVQKIIVRVKDDPSLRSQIHAIESMILR